MTISLTDVYALMTPEDLAASIRTDLAIMRAALGCYRPAPIPSDGAASE